MQSLTLSQSTEGVRSRTITLDGSGAGALPRRGLTGYERLVAMQRGELAPPPAAALLGMQLDESSAVAPCSACWPTRCTRTRWERCTAASWRRSSTPRWVARFVVASGRRRLHDARAEDQLRTRDHAGNRRRVREGRSSISAAGSRPPKRGARRQRRVYADATSTCLINREVADESVTHDTMMLVDGAIADGARDPARRRRSAASACSPAFRPTPCTTASSRRSRAPRAAPSIWLAAVDHDRRDALVALDGDEIVAVARYDSLPGAGDGRGRGDGRGCLAAPGHRPATHRAGWPRAVDHGIESFIAVVMAENRPALGLLRKLSPDASVHFDGGGYEAVDAASRAS